MRPACTVLSKKEMVKRNKIKRALAEQVSLLLASSLETLDG
jgi:hypothetical protein